MLPESHQRWYLNEKSYDLRDEPEESGKNSANKFGGKLKSSLKSGMLGGLSPSKRRGRPIGSVSKRDGITAKTDP